MIRSLWVARTGLDAQQTNLDVIANNLANVSTNGYKRSRAVFEDLLYQTMRQPGAQTSDQTQVPTGLQLGSGVRVVATSHILTQGNLQKTDKPFDIAINGNGYFRIQLPDGTSAYTRDGSFTLNSTGQVTTMDGYLLQPGLTVPATTDNTNISATGVVTYTDKAGLVLGTEQLTLDTFVNPGGLLKIGQNLFLETAASGPPLTANPDSNGTGKVLQNYVETSNVNVAEELVTMIQTQRAYELNSKVISTSDAMLGRLTQL